MADIKVHRTTMTMSSAFPRGLPASRALYIRGSIVGTPWRKFPWTVPARKVTEMLMRIPSRHRKMPRRRYASPRRTRRCSWTDAPSNTSHLSTTSTTYSDIDDKDDDSDGIGDSLLNDVDPWNSRNNVPNAFRAAIWRRNRLVAHASAFRGKAKGYLERAQATI